MDNTNEWKKGKEIKGSIIKKQEYTVNGITYKVDGKHVILNPTEKEKKIATILSEEYGKTVELVPQVMYPQGIQTPDYLIDGNRYDLKSLKSAGKNVVYNMVSKKKTQSSNFILDITNCPLTKSEIDNQIKSVYSSMHTRFIEKIVLLKNGKILEVYDRQ